MGMIRMTTGGIMRSYKELAFRKDGRLRLLIIVGTRPEVIRLSEVIKKCRRHFDCLLAHTGQNYDYTLNGIFFRDLELDDPDVYLDAVGDGLGETMGNIIARSYRGWRARPQPLGNRSRTCAREAGRCPSDSDEHARSRQG